MKFSEYIELIVEQNDDIPQLKKRGGEYVIAGDVNKAIAKAIADKKMISFMYNGPRKPKKDFDGKMMDSVLAGKRNKVFPVALGLSKKNKMIVRCWIQPPNPSKKGFNKKSARDIPNWRTFMVSRMSDVRILDDNFDLNKLTGYNPNGDKSMRVVYKSAKYGAVAKPTVKPKPAKKPVTKPQPTPPKPTAPAPSPPVPQAKPAATPKPKPELKPIPTQKKPEAKPTETPKKLPEVKPKEKPAKTPETDKEEMEPLMGLSEALKRMKTLMSK
jgi:hypothetical protein